MDGVVCNCIRNGVMPEWAEKNKEFKDVYCSLFVKLAKTIVGWFHFNFSVKKLDEKQWEFKKHTNKPEEGWYYGEPYTLNDHDRIRPAIHAIMACGPEAIDEFCKSPFMGPFDLIKFSKVESWAMGITGWNWNADDFNKQVSKWEDGLYPTTWLNRTGEGSKWESLRWAQDIVYELEQSPLWEDED